MCVSFTAEFEAADLRNLDTGMFGFYVIYGEMAVKSAVGELKYGAHLFFFVVMTDKEAECSERQYMCMLFIGCNSTKNMHKEVNLPVIAYGHGVPTAGMRLHLMIGANVLIMTWLRQGLPVACRTGMMTCLQFVYLSFEHISLCHNHMIASSAKRVWHCGFCLARLLPPWMR